MRVYLRTDESGFTLLESLIALMLSSMIMLFLCTSIQQLNKLNELVIRDAQVVASAKSKVKGSRQIEWHLFLNQLEGYLEGTELVSFTSESLIVTEQKLDRGKVKYERAKTGNRGFYRSKNNGNDTMLTDIKRLYLEVDGQCLQLHFIFQNNEEYKGRIWVESWDTESELEKETSNQKRDISCYRPFFCSY